MNKTSKLAQQIMVDTSIIENPQYWPAWPVLPLKPRHGSFLDKPPAFMLAGDTTRIYYYNVALLPDLAKDMMRTRPNLTVGELLDVIELRDFANIDDLLAEYAVD